MARKEIIVPAVRIASVNRAGTSAMGNPTWEITLEDGREFRTQVNSSLGYSVENPENVGRPWAGIPVPVVDLVTTPAGRVYAIRPHAE